MYLPNISVIPGESGFVYVDSTVHDSLRVLCTLYNGQVTAVTLHHDSWGTCFGVVHSDSNF